MLSAPIRAFVYYGMSESSQTRNIKEKGLYQEAIANYSIAIRHNPKIFDIYINRGDMRMKIGDYYGAISDYSIYQQNFATSPKIYLKRGLANLKADFKSKAYIDLKMAEGFGSKEATRIISEQNLSSFAPSSSNNIYQRDRYSYQSLNQSNFQSNNYSYLNESSSNSQRNYYESIRYQNYSYLPRYFSLSELYKNAIKDSPRNNEIPKSNNNEIKGKFEGLDALIHLAADPRPEASRESVKKIILKQLSMSITK